MTERFPNETDAAEIVERVLGMPVARVMRFTTGSANFVYDVELADGQKVVARLGRGEQQDDVAGALAWHRMLEPIGVPLAKLLGYGLETTDGAYPFLLLERLPGRDLAYEYVSLSSEQKRTLARQIAGIQRQVGQLPPGPGYGFAGSYEDRNLHVSWQDVVQASLERSRSRIIKIGVVSPEYVERVAERLPVFSDYFAAIPPTPFLDDTTTKNVIVHEGRLSGIVDIDWICFGDPLFTVALTQTALLSSGNDTDYIGFWAEELGLSAEQRRVLTFYSALFCVDFLSEFGMRFNRDEAPAVDRVAVARLIAILERLLAEIERPRRAHGT